MTEQPEQHPRPSTAVATYTQPRTPHERYVFAQSLAEARQLPGQIRGSIADVLLRIEYGVAVGVPPISAVTAIHMIDGKPSASAGMISGLLRTAGKLRVWTEADPEWPGEVRAVATFRRNDDPEFEYRVEWTIDRAIAAKLLKVADDGRLIAAKSGSAWDTYRAGMLKARAVSEIGRDAAEDVLLGVHYTPEELGARVNEAGEVIEGEIVHEERFVNYAAPAPAPEQTAPAPSTGEGVTILRDLVLAAWQDGDLDALTTIYKGPAGELVPDPSTLVPDLATGEAITVKDLFARVGRAIRDGVPAPGSGDDEGDGGSGGSAVPDGDPAPAGDGGGEVLEGEIVDDGAGPDAQDAPEAATGARESAPEAPPAPEAAPSGSVPAHEPWEQPAWTGGNPLDEPLPPEAVARILGGRVLSAEEVRALELEEAERGARAAEARIRARAAAVQTGDGGLARGSAEQQDAYTRGAAAAREALAARRAAKVGA